MSNLEPYQAPFDVDDPDVTDPDFADARQTWDASDAAASDDGSAKAAEVLVDQWHELVSRTNWEKGNIIARWRQSLLDSGAGASACSDEAWAREVGGITAPHVGRLRRVFDRYGESHVTYPRLSWTHFLVAMDWDDAPMWLQGASDAAWSVAGMRRKRWETVGGVEPQARNLDVATGDIDEDFSSTGQPEKTYTAPAQGGGSTKSYDEQPDGIDSRSPGIGADFGDDESLHALPTTTVPAPPHDGPDAPAPGVLVQPFAGLPELPDDLADAVELLKLSILRHKAMKWESVSVDTVRSYLSAFLILIESRSH